MLLFAFLFTLPFIGCHGGALPFKSEKTSELFRYYLYTRDNPLSPQPLLTDINNLWASPISRRQKTVILVHGHGGSAFTSLNPDVKTALLTEEDVNVIVVDWSIYAGLSYSAAVTTVPTVAISLQNLISQLIIYQVASPSNIHVVGFDLGAHIAGIAGRSLYFTQKIARITGLNPSGNQWGSNSQRLRLTDANYVEVIHTDGGGIWSNGIGDALGHVDFYANGGRNQPGCLTNACSHNRAYELFAASIINPNLVGYPCSSHLQMTLNTCRGLPLRMGTNQLSKIGSGLYRINTRRSFPF